MSKPAHTLTAHDVAEALWLTNSGIEDLTRRLKAMNGTPRDIATLEYVIAAEKGKGNRSTRLKPMEAALKRLSKSAATLALEGESNLPDWSRARQILEGIKLTSRLSLAGRILLGLELITLKMELGFCGSGRRKENPLPAVFKTWGQMCRAELGVSDDYADKLIACYEAAKSKLKRLGGQPRLLTLLETAPAKLDKEAKDTLAKLVDGNEWGETVNELLEEFKILKKHIPTTGGDTSAHQKKKPATAEQLVFAMFAPVEETIGKAARAVENLRLGPDYQRLLYALPIVSSEPGKPSLTALEAQLQAALEGDIAKALQEIRAVKEARMKNPEAKPA